MPSIEIAGVSTLAPYKWPVLNAGEAAGSSKNLAACRPKLRGDRQKWTPCDHGLIVVPEACRVLHAAPGSGCWIKMVFTAPDFVPKLPYDPPDSVSIFDFVFGETYGRPALVKSPAPFVDGLSSREYSAPEVKNRVEWLASALAEELGWDPSKGTERNRVAGLFTVNTVSDVLDGAALVCLEKYRRVLKCRAL